MRATIHCNRLLQIKRLESIGGDALGLFGSDGSVEWFDVREREGFVIIVKACFVVVKVQLARFLFVHKPFLHESSRPRAEHEGVHLAQRSWDSRVC